MTAPKIEIKKTEILSNSHYTLRKYTYLYSEPGSEPQEQRREVYDRGNGASVLLYNSDSKTVILTSQFRMPTYLNGNESGMMIEACAGLIDPGDEPTATVIREAREETGYHIGEVESAFNVYTSPGSVTEILYCYIAPYSKEMKLSEGGGLDEEHENIQILEIEFEVAMQWVREGKICDAKTILLLQHLIIKGLM